MKQYTDDELDSLFKSGFEGHELKPSEGLFIRIQETNKRNKKRTTYWMIPLILLLGTGLSIGVFYFASYDNFIMTDNLENAWFDENITGQQQKPLAQPSVKENNGTISGELTKPNLTKPEKVAAPVSSLENRNHSTIALQETIHEETLQSEAMPSVNPLLEESIVLEPELAELQPIEESSEVQLPVIGNDHKVKPTLVAGIYFSYAKPYTNYSYVENPELTKLRSDNEEFQNSKGVGAFITIPLSPKFLFNVGATFRNQQVDYSYEKEIQNELWFTQVDTHLYRSTIQNRINIRYDTTYKRNIVLSHEQLAGNYSLNYLSIPIDVSYDFLSIRRFSFSAGAGGGFDFLISTSGSLLDLQQDEVIETNIKDANLNTISIYTAAHVGVAYRFAPTYSLFIQPHYIRTLPLNLNEKGNIASPNYLQFRAGIKKSL